MRVTRLTYVHWLPALALALAAAGCDERTRGILEEIQKGAGASHDGDGSGRGGRPASEGGDATGGAGGAGDTRPEITCRESTDASGRQCRICYDAAGAVISDGCSGTPPPPPPS